MDQKTEKASVQRIKSDFRTVSNRAAESTRIVGPDFKIPEDDWVPFLKLGEFPVKNQNATLRGVQVVDEIAAQSIVNNHTPGEELLLDFDHFSRNPEKGTTAAGWIQEFQVRDLVVENRGNTPEKYVFARIKWSNSGREAIEGGDFRFISPDLTEWESLGNGRYRPHRTVGGGLTNRTAITGQLPVSNRNTEEENMDHKQILIGLLGLAADATDQVISNRVTEFKNEVVSNREAADKVAGLEQTIKSQTEQLVDGDLKTYAAVITNRDAVREQLMNNREGTIALLSGIKVPESPAQSGNQSKAVVYNRDTATPPKPGTEAPASENPENIQRAAVISNRAKELINGNENLSLVEAYSRAKAEIESE